MMAKLNVTTVPEVVRAAAMLERADVSLAPDATAEADEQAPLEAADRTPRLLNWRSSFLQSLPAGS